MTCPRCGEEIDSLPCSECGFPILFVPVRRKLRKRRFIQLRFRM